MASSNEKEYTVTVTETKTWRVKINASSSEKAEEIVCERHGPIENETEAEYEAVFGGAEILNRGWDIKTWADVEACLKEQDNRPFRNYYFCRVCLYPHGEGNWEAQCEPCVNCEVPDVVWQFQAQDEKKAAILAEKYRLRH